MSLTLAESVSASPLYADLTTEETAEVASGMELRRFDAGHALMRQGESSDGAYLIVSGLVDVAARLPGGGETAIACLGPGDMVGEMALLLRGGKRTANARARAPVEALFADRRSFDAAVNRLRPSSLKVLRRLGLMTAERLRAIRLKSRALVEISGDGGLCRALPYGDTHPTEIFDVRDFLPILPCLRGFSPEQLDRLFSMATVETIVRGQTLLEEGQTISSPRLVVRGAVLLGQRQGEQICQLDILGPGRFVGVAPVLERATAAATIIAVEDTTLLAFDGGRFADLWGGHDPLSLKLLEAINGDLVASLNTASNHLTRLNAQTRLRWEQVA